jgi:hypothetical protein
MIARLVDTIWGSHFARYGALQDATMQAHSTANLLARHAPAALVAEYVARCRRADEAARWWGVASTVLGGWTPWAMWAGAMAAGLSGGWSVVAAQLVWGLAWFGYGLPRFDYALMENRFIATYEALKPMCDVLPDDVLAEIGIHRVKPDELPQ